MIAFNDVKIGEFFIMTVIDGEAWYGAKVKPIEATDCDGFSMECNAFLFNKQGQSFFERLNPMHPIMPIDKV